MLVAEDILQTELDKGRADCSPVSRQMLAKRLERDLGLSHREAWAKVDEWCDESAPAVPAYLGGEFGTYWLKSVAIANVTLGFGVFGWAAREAQRGHQAWPWFAGGVLLFGVGGVLTYVRSFTRAKA